MVYKSFFTSAASVTALQRQVKLTNLEDSYKIVIHASESDDFPFLMVTSSNLPFFFMYRFLFEILGLVLELKNFFHLDVVFGSFVQLVHATRVFFHRLPANLPGHKARSMECNATSWLRLQI